MRQEFRLTIGKLTLVFGMDVHLVRPKKKHNRQKNPGV